MTDHTPHSIERHCDVCIVGGSAAGLAAALQLVRQRRSVIVIDSGEPRNGPAAHVHGYLTREGVAPSSLVDAGAAEVRSYGGEVLIGDVRRVTRGDDGCLRAELADGSAIVARRVLAATGLIDDLPDIEGLAGRWGRDVIHCPFCHGFEARDRAIVAVVDHPAGLQVAPLLRQLSARLTIVLRGDVAADTGEVDALRAAGVDVHRGSVSRLVTAPDGALTGVELAGGEHIEAGTVVVGTRFRPRVEPFVPLGLQPIEHPSGLGDVVETDPTGATSVPGLFAAGNVTDPSQQVLQAAADGSRVGAMIAFSLADEDLRSAARRSGNAADWDHRYDGEAMWSGNPNGTLVAEVADLQPGRALDVGAGEGGDALWLAEHGWTVTASDISQRALDRVRMQAERRGLQVQCHHADANALDAFDSAVFDLVSAQYASIPRTPDRRAVHTILDAVAPGGALLVVGHDPEPMRLQAGDRRFDPDAYVGVEDFRAVLADSPAWRIEVHEKRPRPAGAVSAHHVEDVVLRARRRHTR